MKQAHIITSISRKTNSAEQGAQFPSHPLYMSPLQCQCVSWLRCWADKKRGMRMASGTRKGGREDTVGVMKFGGLKVGYSAGSSCRWHPFGRINQHTCSCSAQTSHPS